MNKVNISVTKTLEKFDWFQWFSFQKIFIKLEDFRIFKTCTQMDFLAKNFPFQEWGTSARIIHDNGKFESSERKTQDTNPMEKNINRFSTAVTLFQYFHPFLTHGYRIHMCKLSVWLCSKLWAWKMWKH